MAHPVGREASRRASGVSRGGFLGIDDVVLMAEGLADDGAEGDRIGLMQLASAWRRAVGETLARASRPGGMRGSTLLVDVRDAAWKRELERLEPLIRGRLARLLPARTIRGVAFQIDRALRAAPARARGRPTPHGARASRAGGQPDLFRAPAHDILARFNEVMGRYLEAGPGRADERANPRG